MRSPFELSGGQKRRAAIAGVLAMQPSVFILDEPTAGLDPKSHAEILNMVCKIKKNKEITVILVSHNMDDIARLCTKVLVMDQGKLVLSGTPREVFSKSDLLKRIGLGLPQASELIERMRSLGAEIEESVLFPQEAADAIERYFKSAGAGRAVSGIPQQAEKRSEVR